MGRIIITLMLSICVSYTTYSQNTNELKETFHEAEFFILYEDYEEALTLYQNVYNKGLSNAYIKHRIGECYLQIPGQKAKSIPYLEEACENLSGSIREGWFKETKAPYRALFYLACAYQTNNELDKAIETFKKFEDLASTEKNYNFDYIYKQIQSCIAAKKLMNEPDAINEVNIGNQINNKYPNIRPVISADEKSIVYQSELKFYDAIFYSTKENGEWSTPVNITPDLQSDGNFYTCFLSGDGKTLTLYRADEFNSDIYISHLENNHWSTPKKLNKNINSRHHEIFASLSNDGKTLFFISDRKGGFGGFDIYKSHYDESKKDWGEAINLGREVNTPFNEQSPVICENGTTLYFSSQGHYNMGGFDVFYTENIEKNLWTKPVNAGYPINSTDDNLFYYPLDNGKKAYISKYDQNGFGHQDIVMLEIKHPQQ